VISCFALSRGVTPIKLNRTICVAAAILLFTIVNRAPAGVIVSQHVGANDPTTEGWLDTDGGAGSSVGPVFNDAASGFDAWQVHDTGSTRIRNYQQHPPASIMGQALQQGWTLRARVRVVDPATPADGPISFDVSLINRVFHLDIGSDADGDPVVRLLDDTTPPAEFTIQGAGGGYHLFEMIYDPTTLLADVRVDSQHVADYEGYLSPLTVILHSVRFGGDGDAGRGNYNLVQFEVVPEPGGGAAVGTALLVAIAVRRRQRNARRH
jgi:hypothetical protein